MLLHDKRQDTLAFDLAPTARRLDGDGHLHVARTAISKANVCEYLGREIPNWRDLGLDADRRYKLLRDPEELAKAVDSFNGKPLLLDHNPVNADDHDHTRTVGALSNAAWDPPYLRADLSCWSGPAIRLIQDGSQKELSSAYRYRADMTAGRTEDGHAYDGVMRDIVANHVALVKKGRAGPDVVVGDSAPSRGTLIMASTALSRAAAHTQGALFAYLRPKLAQDKAIDLGPIVAGLTAKTMKTSVPAIVLGVQKAARGKLAQDADLDDLPEVVEALVDLTPPEVAETVEGKIDDMAGAGGEGNGGEAQDDAEGAKAFLKEKGLTDEEIERVLGMLGGAPAMDRKAVATAVQTATKGMVSKPAMDAAIDAAVTRARTEAAAEQRAIREAERAVHPWVGDLAMAHDSAEDVYRTALGALKVDVAGVHPSAYPAILKATSKPSEVTPRPARLAMDAAATKDFADRFPHANRLK
ncbi:DUF2213 domain-containing protein [Methylobacterium sp. NMS14P]|uniref:DUF2213 domain-containing protein n=1 Tax=Methylobacterium sp. NMS14P TaxID=2894310 RepID=UPI002358FA28|nr:DUF2213 domain-containing protein [Methylobacterium sp. NMS14P]WCS27246.1 DUF2213 domain-containing protein [Methylobacterium sp. NMS14P]